MKKNKLMLVVLIAGLLLTLPAVAKLTRVSHDFGLQFGDAPEVAGDFIVWAGPSNGVFNHVRSTGVTTLAQTGTGTKIYPMVNENGDIVWEDAQGTSSQNQMWDATNLTGTNRGLDWINLDQDGNTAAYAFINYDLPGNDYDIAYVVNNGAPVIFTTGIVNPDGHLGADGTTDYNRFRMPDTDSTSVVFYDWDWGHVWLHDIGTGVNTRIGLAYDKGNIYNSGPRVDGDFVVWENKDDSVTDIVLYQISTATTTILWNGSDFGLNAQDPKIHEGHVIWEASYVVYLYDIASATTIVLEGASGLNEYNPQIEGNFVTFSDNAGDVWVYDIALGTYALVTDAAFDLIGWTQGSNAEAQVYDDNGHWVVGFEYYEHGEGFASVMLAEQIPEPSTIFLMIGSASGLAVAAGVMRRKLR